MHQQSLSHLISNDFTKQFVYDNINASKRLSDENEEKIKEQIPDNVTIPSGENIRDFKTWEMKYRTDNPKASDRQVKRAIVKQFNIIVIKGQNYIPKK